MTTDEILKLAKECGIYSDTAFHGINKFAQAILEEAAKGCDIPDSQCFGVGKHFAAAIRALKEKK